MSDEVECWLRESHADETMDEFRERSVRESVGVPVYEFIDPSIRHLIEDWGGYRFVSMDGKEDVWRG